MRAGVLKILTGFRASERGHSLARTANGAYLCPERRTTAFCRSLAAYGAHWHDRVSAYSVILNFDEISTARQFDFIIDFGESEITIYRSQFHSVLQIVRL